MNHTPGPCHNCGRTYTAEPEDFGLCCICERDLLGLRSAGSEWIRVLKAAPTLAAENARLVEACQKKDRCIVDLHAENARLREALKRAINHLIMDGTSQRDVAEALAQPRAALAGEA